MLKLIATLAVALALLAPAAAQSASSKARAVKAVRGELRDRFPVAEVQSISCRHTAGRRYRCTWSVDDIEVRYRGQARATVYRRGAEADLYSVRCIASDTFRDFCDL